MNISADGRIAHQVCDFLNHEILVIGTRDPLKTVPVVVHECNRYCGALPGGAVAGYSQQY